MEKEFIRAIVKEPHKDPEWREIKNDLETLQQLVGGCFETLGFTVTSALICNEEGNLLDLEPNIRLWNDMICGTIVIVGVQEDYFTDAPNAAWLCLKTLPTA